MKSFKQWVENLEVRKQGTQAMILAFLKSQLHIDDDETILGMRTTDIDSSIIAKLTNRGEISHSSNQEDIKNMIQNGVTIQELIDAVAEFSNTDVI